MPRLHVADVTWMVREITTSLVISGYVSTVLYPYLFMKYPKFAALYWLLPKIWWYSRHSLSPSSVLTIFWNLASNVFRDASCPSVVMSHMSLGLRTSRKSMILWKRMWMPGTCPAHQGTGPMLPGKLSSGSNKRQDSEPDLTLATPPDSAICL